RCLRCTRRARSGGEPLATLRAAALENRATRSGGHARTEAVLALPPADIGLVRAFHVVRLPVSQRRRGEVGVETRPSEADDDAFRPAGFPQRSGCRVSSKSLHTGIGRCPGERVPRHFPQVWRMVWRRSFSLHTSHFSGSGGVDRGSLSGPVDAAMLAPL